MGHNSSLAKTAGQSTMPGVGTPNPALPGERKLKLDAAALSTRMRSATLDHARRSGLCRPDSPPARAGRDPAGSATAPATRHRHRDAGRSRHMRRRRGVYGELGQGHRRSDGAAACRSRAPVMTPARRQVDRQSRDCPSPASVPYRPRRTPSGYVLAQYRSPSTSYRATLVNLAPPVKDAASSRGRTRPRPASSAAPTGITSFAYPRDPTCAIPDQSC